MIRYHGYDRACEAWLKGRADAWTRTYAAVIWSSNIKTASEAANEAVKAYELNFPQPESPHGDDYD